MENKQKISLCKKYLGIVFFVVLSLFLVLGCSSDDDGGGNGSDTDDQPQQSLIIDMTGQASTPSNVVLNFSVEDREGNPVKGLDLANLVLLEDGRQPSMAESNMTIFPPTLNTILMLDLSGSVTEESLDTLVESAKKFVMTVISSGHEVAIYYFQTNANMLQGFTQDYELLEEALDDLSNHVIPGATTNLYRAFIAGLDKLDEKKKISQRMNAGSLVVFTDGRDTAGMYSYSEIESLVSHTEHYVFTIGLNTPDLDVTTLDEEHLGKDGFEMVEELSQLEQAFDNIAVKIQKESEKFYVLAYASPSRGDKVHTVIVELTVTTPGGLTGTATYTYNSYGFIDGGYNVVEKLKLQYYDDDEDGHYSVDGDLHDVDDSNPYVWTEEAYHACTDMDGDGFPGTNCDNNGDCDDTDPFIYPGADDVEGDGVDQNCDGFDDYAPDLKYKDVLAFYPFDESLEDASANRNDAWVEQGKEILYASGHFNNTKSALLIEENDDYIRIPVFGPNRFSISMWYYYVPNYEASDNAIISRGENSNFIPLYIDRSGFLSIFAGKAHKSAFKLPPYQWTHIVLINEDTNYQLYVNNQKMLETDLPLWAIHQHPVQFIGNYSNVNSFKPYMAAKGKYDDIRIYDRLLTPKEINILYFETQKVETKGTNILMFGNVVDPSIIMLNFILEHNEEVIPGISMENFAIFEDGEVPSPSESNLTPFPADLHTALMLDLSGSITRANLEILVEAAKEFVNELVSEHHWVALYYFQTEVSLLQDFTNKKGLLLGELNRLDQYVIEGATTNLHGAFLDGVYALDKVSVESDTMVAGSIVVFTDGQETAEEYSYDEARVAVKQTIHNVFTIGLSTPELDHSVLDRGHLGKNGFEMVETVDDLPVAFARIAETINYESQKYHVLAYTSPSRGSKLHTVELVVTTPDGDVISSAYDFNSQEFTDGGYEKIEELKLKYYDADQDGYYSVNGPLMDMDDTDPYNWTQFGVTNCTDADGDGFRATNCDIPEDCNDETAQIHPNAIETRYDGVDQNCNGYDNK